MKKRKAICILGGMGPQASIYLYKLLIEISERCFGAKNNDDYPDIVLYSVPVPDFISNNQARGKALKMLNQKVHLVNKSNAGSIAIACNTAHVLLPDLQEFSKVPFVSMIEVVVKQAVEDGITKVGLLGTPSTIKYGLYQDALEKYGISTEIPSHKQIRILEKVIRNVLSGKQRKDDTIRLEKISNDFKTQGAEGIILGCTELPLVFPENYPLPIYNCLEILALALLRKHYGQ